MKKSNLYFVLLVCLIISSSYSQTKLNRGYTTKKSYYTEVSFEFVRGKIIIPVYIQGKTYRFLLDTGAPNLITSKLNEQIKTKNLKVNNVRDANNNKSKLRVVSIPELFIGDVSFKKSANLVYQLSENIIFDCFKIDGFIGSNLLRHSVLHIDLKRKKLIITNSVDQIKSELGKPIPLILVGNQRSPYIWIEFDGEKKAREKLLIDTGMPDLYDLSKRHYKSFKPLPGFKVIDSGLGSTSISLFGNAKKSKQLRVLVPPMRIGQTKFKRVITQTTDDTNSRIGSEILKYGLVTIDFKNKQFYYKSRDSVIDINEGLFKISPTLVNNTMKVGMIWDKSLQNDIEIGDEIVEINDVVFSETPYCDYVVKDSPFGTKDTLNITIKTKQGQVKSFTMKKQYYNYD